MDGYRGRDYYTASEFKEGCTFNYWFGACSGVVGTILTALGLAWVFNII